MKILDIRIRFEDGKEICIDRYQLEQVEESIEAINMLERAKSMYLELKQVFK